MNIAGQRRGLFTVHRRELGLLVADLVELGHDVDTAVSEGLAGHEDPEVWSGAQAAERMLLTQDLDFSDVRPVEAWARCFVVVTDRKVRIRRLRPT